MCVCVSRCATVSWQSSIHFMVMDSTLTLWFSRQIACKHIIYMFIPVHLSSGPIPNVIIHWVASRDNVQFYTGCSGFYRIGPNCRGLWNQPEFHPDQFQKFKILVMAKCRTLRGRSFPMTSRNHLVAWKNSFTGNHSLFIYLTFNISSCVLLHMLCIMCHIL